jgi:hypothetical protein
LKTGSAAAVAAIGWAVAAACAAVTPEEAVKLKTTLTPLGAEKAGNADGTVPAWEGGLKQPGKSGGRRSDPFSDDRPIYTVTAQNLAQYADRLSEGQQAMFRKYPNYRIDVFRTRRTASAPDWVYDNTFRNATRARTTRGGYSLEGAYGGVPFPIPKTGTEAMWNHVLSWNGEALEKNFRTYITTADGKRVMAADSVLQQQYPYYFKDGSAGQHDGIFLQARLVTNGPPQKAGEAVAWHDPLDQVGVGRQTWQYLTGQRRVRRLPNAAYDTPSFVASGVSNLDEIYVFNGPMDRFDWKLAGKKEMLVPYNNNRILGPKTSQAVLSERFLNPDFVRWELHRVWVVEATLAQGKRHVMPRRRFYLDEDTWLALLADGWDAKGQLWKTFWYLNIVAPELPGVVPGMFGHYNLQTGDWIANDVMNEKDDQIRFMAPLPGSHFSPDALAGEGVR